MSTPVPSESVPASADVVVIGAGPAGATCALELGRAGFDVVLVDKAAPPRYKTCGGGIVGRALESLDVEVSESFERRLHRVELNLTDGGASRSFSVERSQPPIVMTMRASFDTLLVQAACAAGVKLLAPVTFSGLSHRKSEWVVATDCGEIRTSWVVGADGAGSRVARAAGWVGAPRSVPAIESEIQVPADVFDRFAGAARFDFGIIPHGYGWVFPKRDHLSVGALATRRDGKRARPGARSLNHFFEEYLRAVGIEGTLEREDHGFVIPVEPRKPLARGGVLLVGDAAGLGDPLTCEGISNAIRSGRHAAQALVQTRDAPSRTKDAYEGLMAQSILPELRWARRFAPLLYDHPRLRDFVFRRVGDKLCDAFTDVFSGRRTLRGLLGRPATYGRLLGALVGSSGQR